MGLFDFLHRPSGKNTQEVIKEVENKNVQEGFAVLKKELMNNCTYQFLKDIKKFYKV